MDATLGCALEHKLHTFLREPMPVPHPLIVGLGIRQAESGLVEKQERGLFRLKTIGLEGLAAVIGALAITAPLGRKHAALPAAARREVFRAQACRLCAQ